MALAASQVLGKRSRVLVEIDLPGRVLRFTTDSEAVAVLDADGVECVYQPGVEPVPTDVHSRELRSSVGLTIMAEPGAETWAELRELGYRFELAGAVVRHHYDGQKLEQARVVLRGRVTSPNYGARDEGFTCTVKRRLRKSGVMPLPSMRVGVETWAGTIDPEILGAVYPIIIGRPGKISGSATCPVTPALLVDFAGTNNTSNKWLVAGHECAAGTVTLHDLTDGTSVVATISHENDALGRNVAVITGVVFGSALGNEYLIAWDGTAGGVLNRDRSGPLEGGAEVVRYLLQTWAPDVLVDASRFDSDDLDGFKLAFAINEITDPWSFIQRHILPILPAEMRESNDGLWLEYVSLAARPEDVRWKLVATIGAPDQNCVRQGRIRGGNGEITNRVRFLYGIGGQDYRFLRTVISDRNDDTNTDARVRGSILADVSQSEFDVQEEVIETKAVYQDSTATRLAEERLLLGALPRRQISVVGGPELDELEVGTVGEYTEAGVHMEAKLALLRSKDPQETQTILQILVLDDYMQSERRTS